MVFSWVSMGFNGLQWVSMSFNGFYRVSLCFNGFRLPSFTGFHRVVPFFFVLGFYPGIVDHIALGSGSSGLEFVVEGFIGLPWFFM